MDTKEITKLLFTVQPHWHNNIGKPFKKVMLDGLSPAMFYCINVLSKSENDLTITELGKKLDMPKQQLTKITTKLVDSGFIERKTDNNDRRLILLHPTNKANNYIESFSKHIENYYIEMINSLSEKDRDNFGQSLKTILDVFEKLPKGENK